MTSHNPLVHSTTAWVGIAALAVAMICTGIVMALPEPKMTSPAPFRAIYMLLCMTAGAGYVFGLIFLAAGQA